MTSIKKKCIQSISSLKFAILYFIAFGGSQSLQAQSKPEDTLSLSLSDAIEYATTSNTEIKNSYADIAIADQTVKEVTAIGIPQLKGQVQLQDAIQKQVFVFPVNGVATPIRVGNKYTTTAALNFSWLVLDGTYFLGLKAAKQYTGLSKRISDKTIADVKIDVAKTYFLALITKENISLVNSSYNTLKSTFDQVTALNKEGFTESLDVDRLKLQLNNLEISKQKLNDQYNIVLDLLKSKIGLSSTKPINLTDDIDAINQKFNAIDTSSKVNLKSRSDFQILQQQLILNQYDVKRYKFGKYPSLAAAFTLQQSNFGEEIDYSNWYGNSFLAVQMNIPIFSGFANNAKIQIAKIEQLKTENTISNVKNLIDIEVNQTKLAYLRALEYVVQQKENLDLANKILNITTIKYNEGVGSNLELITANQDLKNTQTNYLNSIYDLLVAKIDYQVALGIDIKP
jgi:outer membrane protein